MSIHKPPRVPVNATIGVVASSLQILPSWQSQYAAGKQLLTSWGFHIREGNTIHLQGWWLAGTPQQQANDIQTTFSDPDVDAVLAVTGGFFALRVVDHLDYNVIQQSPKPLIGMSDNSIYQWALLTHCGLVSFHGNNLHDAFGGYVANASLEEQALWKSIYLALLMKPNPYGANPQLSTWETWRAGIAKGRLIGGNLKRVTSLIGTTHFPPMEMFNGALFFWEEIAESLYDITLNLHKWKHIGVFERIGGMIIGQPVWVNEYFHEIHHPTLEETVMDVVKEYSFPILAQVDFGHNHSMLPLPIGIEAEMDTSTKAIVIVEAAVK